MRHLGLHQRAALLREHFELPSFSHQTLFNYYRRLGVAFTKPQLVYHNKKKRAREISDQQQEFSRSLTLRMMHDPDLEVIYLDETTFHLW